MGVIGNTFKRSFSKWFNPSYYGLLKLVLLSALKKSGGTTKVMGFKVRYTDAKSLMGMYNEIVYQDHYEFLSKTNNPTIIDCGANIGISALYFYKLFPEANIIAVEADPDVAKICKDNLSQNNYNGEVISKAVWSNSNEQLSFGKEGSDAGSLFSKENCMMVDTIDIRELLAQHEHIDLLKIDIEGAETEVIKRCKDSLSNVERVFVEFHSFQGSPQGLEDILKTIADQGFRYIVMPARKLYKPFITKGLDRPMDLQLNIFFFRP